MEVSVSFTGEGEERDWSDFTEDRFEAEIEGDIEAAGNRGEDSALGGGRVFIAKDRLVVTGPVRVRYEKYPWLEKFEVDGVKPAEPKRTGFGTKDARGFVKSLNTIYAKAYDDYRTFSRETGAEDAATSREDGFDAENYFRHVSEHFIRLSHDAAAAKLYRKFCGFTENMWREGNEEMYHTAMDIILTAIKDDKAAWQIFTDNITEEFREYIRDYIKERNDGEQEE